MKQHTNELVYFCQYQCFYYGASSNAWEAAYINCFDENKKQVGRIIFLQPGIPVPPGQVNRIEPAYGVVIYFPLAQFNDVVNLLRHAVNTHYCSCRGDGEKHEAILEKESMFFSVNEPMNIWAICNNHYMAVGAQYHV